MPTTEEITEQVAELEGKALSFVQEYQSKAVELVGKASETLAARLPEDRPEQLSKGINTVLGQVDFAKKVVDTQNDFVKAVLDALVAPFKPAPVKKTVKAATAA
jgi:hypothetical protein